ncbi:acetyltransferase protein [Stemphylium lycopersici]|uniref:Acetyltransferase protein n=1 Tax=Stemphylium lycopersici TaxID=183478 RepID=A0A364N084_STELY|nr:acetyltransferase protein [Stemphylium lycopersici]RAR08272.1 acetyltransferase protein [Stemphylium lycopersici]RAR10377.1 acetyltransferase protein [Stemphylium lycopersici]
MRRQLPPSHLKVPPGPHAFPRQQFLGQETVVVNHYAGIEKSIPVIPSLPGFRTSAAFLTSLSANLRIDPDLPSPLPTPTGFRLNNFIQPVPPTSLSYSTSTAPYNPYVSTAETEIMSTEARAPAKAPVDELPQLSTYTAETEDDRIEGLRLVADSVAQQRQVASKAMMFHPVTLTAYVVAVAIAAQYMLRWYEDKMMLVTTIGGISMTFLIFIRWMTGGYIGMAEDINMEWLGGDRLIVVKWGEDVIGSLVLGWADNDAAKKRGRRRRGKAVVRAWTVALKYRGKGLGGDLLEEAVKVAGERGADGIVFDADHANSQRVLPSLFNGFLNKQDAKAEKALQKVADAKGNFRQRQSSPTWGSR